MDEELESLLVDVRANTQGFTADMEAMRGAVDASLVGGFERAGSVLERGLLSAVRRGSLGFDDLKRVVLSAIDDIAAQAVKIGFGAIGGSGSGGLGAILGTALGGLLGLPGRATGGPVGPGNAYLVGERGPEVFVPTSAGRVEPAQARPRDVRVAIQLSSPRGTSAPAALQRSARQVASSVRRAIGG